MDIGCDALCIRLVAWSLPQTLLAESVRSMPGFEATIRSQFVRSRQLKVLEITF
jgi:hypothetical protein